MRSKADFAALGKTDEDMTIAQLHYTTLVHLGRARDLLEDPLDRWRFAEVIVRLTGASDCGDELLQRSTHRGEYEPWSESAGRDARQNWRKTHGRPLKDIHDYRNRMVHGRVVPEWTGTLGGERIYVYPTLNRINDYLDWREAFAALQDPTRMSNFAPAQKIGTDAWIRTVDYVEEQWQKHLLPGVTASG